MGLVSPGVVTVPGVEGVVDGEVVVPDGALVSLVLVGVPVVVPVRLGWAQPPGHHPLVSEAPWAVPPVPPVSLRRAFRAGQSEAGGWWPPSGCLSRRRWPWSTWGFPGPAGWRCLAGTSSAPRRT